MIVTNVAEAREVLGARGDFPADQPGSMRSALLVTPEGFRISSESATDNRYMELGTELDVERACAQHQALVDGLLRLGVPVTLFAGVSGLDDGIYPNNVFATASPCRFIIGSMRHAVREDVRAFFNTTLRYKLHDLSREDCVAELTGPLVIDRPRRIGYCGMTDRVDDAGCAHMHEAFHLRAIWRFDLVATEYHTNLILAILAGRACVAYAAAFCDSAVVELLGALYDERILLLSDDEKSHFAGNCLAVTENDVLFSRTAMKALRPESAEKLRSWGFSLHDVEIDELEKGGGSLRCLIAEVF